MPDDETREEPEVEGHGHTPGAAAAEAAEAAGHTPGAAEEAADVEAHMFGEGHTPGGHTPGGHTPGGHTPG